MGLGKDSGQCGNSPTPIVGEKLSVNASSQNRSISDVFPTVLFPSSSSFSSFVLISRRLDAIAHRRRLVSPNRPRQPWRYMR